jgi:hypothetical protein
VKFIKVCNLEKWGGEEKMTTRKKDKKIMVPINDLKKISSKTINLTVDKLMKFIDSCFESVVKDFFNKNKLPILSGLPLNYKKTIEKLVLRRINDSPEKYLFVLSYIYNFLNNCLTNRQLPLIKDNMVYLYFKVNPFANYYYYYDTISSEVLNSIKSDDYTKIKNLIGSGDDEQIKSLLECISDQIKFYLNNLNLEELVDETINQFSKVKSDDNESRIRAYEELLLCILIDLGMYLEMPLDLSTMMIKKVNNDGIVSYPSVEKLTSSTIASEEEGRKVLEISLNTYKYYVSLFNKISKNYEKFNDKVSEIYHTIPSSLANLPDEIKYKNVSYLIFLGTILHAAVYSITLPECALYLLAVPSLKIIKQLEWLFTKYNNYYNFKINTIYNRSTKETVEEEGEYHDSFTCSNSFRFDPVSRTYKSLSELNLNAINSIKNILQKRIHKKLNSLYHPIFIKKINDNFCYIVEEKPKSPTLTTKYRYLSVNKYRNKIENLYKIMYDLENKLNNLSDTFNC